MANSVDLIGFDLDGTLLDTSFELTEALNVALGEAGQPPLARASVLPMIGLGAKHMLRMGLGAAAEDDPDLVDRMLPALLAHYEDNLGANSPLYSGLAEVMARCDRDGIAMAVVTNKYEHLAVKLLQNIGISGRFTCIIGGDTLGRGKSKPDRAPIDAMLARSGVSDPRRAVFVGDSIYDVEAAHGAGVKAVAVGFGFLHQPVAELGADAVIDHYDELFPTIGRLLG